MKTDVAKKTSLNTNNTSNDKYIDKQEMKVTRKSLHPLQEAAGDKENLVGAGRMLRDQTANDNLKGTRQVSENGPSGKVEKKKKEIICERKFITAEDLTSQAGPSEHYWEVLAERRRVALEVSMQENERLHDRIALLEEENRQCKDLLEETKGLVDTLTEMLGDNTASETDDSLSENFRPRQ